ncbi:MAG: hypothetical protein IJW14_02120 [Oscillospiraceae bacterium]|nr:hypothetical protein [Oscillospiraceae bacterium]
MTLRKKLTLPTMLFLLIELVLYGLILTTSGQLLVYSSFISIAICFAHVLFHYKNCDKFILTGLFFTVCADFCLVICSPIQQLWGMCFFLITQTLYAVKLHREQKSKPLLYARISLILLAVAVTVLVLGEKTDALALVSLCYYANLIMNIIVAFTKFRQAKLFPIALALFLLCDTVIGLQVACGAYLPIAEGSLLHNIIFMDFNLSWFFYLPSQVLISLSGKAKRPATPGSDEPGASYFSSLQPMAFFQI